MSEPQEPQSERQEADPKRMAARRAFDSALQERRRRPKPANCGVLSVQEVADMLYMSRSSVYKDIEETHVIPGCVKIGKRVFFSRAKVERWLADPEAYRESTGEGNGRAK